MSWHYRSQRRRVNIGVGMAYFLILLENKQMLYVVKNKFLAGCYALVLASQRVAYRPDQHSLHWK